MSRRCKHSGQRGQCHSAAIDCSDFCERHSSESDRIMSYQLSDPDLKGRFEHHSRSECLQTLRDEVVLLRSLVNQRLDLAKTDAEKISAFAVVHPALSTLDKLVNSLSKLERQTAVVLDKAAAQRLAVDIGKILIDELNDVNDRDAIIDRVSKRIAQAIMDARNEEKD